MIRIAVDARALEEAHATGVARYLRNILREWDRRPRAAVEVWCYTRAPVEDMTNFRSVHWRVVPAEPWRRKGILWQNTAFAWTVARDRADVLWSPFNLAPLITHCPVVVTIHDVSFVAQPAWFGRHERLIWGPLARLSARRAATTITDSWFSQGEIMRHWHLPPDAVAVIPLAADATFRPADHSAVEALRRRLGLNGAYVLYVGALFARRNIIALLDAMAGAARQHPDWHLVLVGVNRHYPPLDLDAAIASRALGGRVHHLPYVTEAELITLYSGALTFVDPSSYEGFGLPVLEAMACGTAVVTGHATSLPEVAGDAAILVDPTSSRALGAALQLVGSQPRLRAELRERGLRRAAQFSWARTAERTLDVLLGAARSA